MYAVGSRKHAHVCALCIPCAFKINKNRIHDSGDEDKVVGDRRKYDCYREDRKF